MEALGQKNELGIAENLIKPEKKKKKFPFLGVFLPLCIILVVGLSVLGYGYYNGQQIKKYALKSEGLFAETKNWEKQAKGFDGEPKKVKEELVQIQRYSKNALLELSKASPKRTESLRKDLQEYFRQSEKAAASAIEIVEWSVGIQDLSEKLTKSTTELDVSSPQNMTLSLENIKKEIDDTVLKMDKMDVPASLEKDQAELKKSFVELSVLYEKLITAIKTNDLASLSTSATEVAKLEGEFDSEKFGQEIVTTFEKSEKELETLSSQINSEISALKRVNFSF